MDTRIYYRFLTRYVLSILGPNARRDVSLLVLDIDPYAGVASDYCLINITLTPQHVTLTPITTQVLGLQIRW